MKNSMLQDDLLKLAEEKDPKNEETNKDPKPEQNSASKDEPVKDADKGKDPADNLTPDHPRFQEVYRKMKDNERKAQELELTINDIRQHNKILEEKLTKPKNDEDGEIPNPTDDPAGYAKWVKEQTLATYGETEVDRQKKRTAEQVAEMRLDYDDYDDIVASFNEEFQKTPDEVVYKRIMGSVNPAKALYREAKKKVNEKVKQREAAENLAPLSSSDSELSPKPKNKIVLSDAQKRVVHGLGITEEQYIKQLELDRR